MSEVARLTWEDVVKEYPKFREIADKHPNLKEGVLEIKIAPRGPVNHYHTSFRSASMEWDFETLGGSIHFTHIEKENEEAAGPFLVLGTWIFIKRDEQIKKSTRGGWVHLVNLARKGPTFWAKFFGLKTFAELIRIVPESPGQGWDAYENVFTFPYSTFDQMINREWKK